MTKKRRFIEALLSGRGQARPMERGPNIGRLPRAGTSVGEILPLRDEPSKHYAGVWVRIAAERSVSHRWPKRPRGAPAGTMVDLSGAPSQRNRAPSDRGHLKLPLGGRRKR